MLLTREFAPILQQNGGGHVINTLSIASHVNFPLGATYDGKMVGTFGDVGTCSFYPAHHITMGEGGAVFTDDGKLKIQLASFRDWGRDCFCEPGQDDTCKETGR